MIGITRFRMSTKEYPYNLVDDITLKVNTSYVDDVENQVSKALAELTETESSVILARYKDGLTRKRIAIMYNSTIDRVRNTELTALRKLRHPRIIRMISPSATGVSKPQIGKVTRHSPVDELDLTVRSYNCLMRWYAAYGDEDREMTVGDVINLYHENRLRCVRNLGAKSIEEVVSALKNNCLI